MHILLPLLLLPLQVPLLKHVNILSFLAAGSKPTEAATNDIGYYTLLKHCHPVTLSEYLQENSLSVDHMISCVTDVLRGLSHLHCDISKGSVTKPIIAHCQLTSDNILVKSDGQFSDCCIRVYCTVMFPLQESV